MRPSIEHLGIPISENYCLSGFEALRIQMEGAISFDLIIDLYVTLRLIINTLKACG